MFIFAYYMDSQRLRTLTEDMLNIDMMNITELHQFKHLMVQTHIPMMS